MEKDQDIIIGLDIGETSIGWALIDNIEKNIIDIGVRCWNKSEDRQGNTLSRKRREYRGRRRVIRRKAHRKQRLKNTILKYNILNETQLENLLSTVPDKDIYTLRYDALNKLITNEELSRILIRLSKNRGFKSNRKSDKESEGVLNDAISENEKLMKEKGYRTAGEMLQLDSKFEHQKKNTDGTYMATISRKLIENEIELILRTQQSLGNKLISDDFISDIMKIIIEQRPFASGEDIKNLVGNCTFEENEKRAPKATYSFSEFNVRQALNKLSLIDENMNKLKLTNDQIEIIHDKIFSSSGKYTYNQIRKSLNLDEKIHFNGLDYKDDIKQSEKKEFINIQEFIKIQKQLKQFNLNDERLDFIGEVLSYYKTDEDIKKELLNENFEENIIQKVLNINITSSKPCHLSLKALRKINVGLKKGLLYNEACEEAGYDFKAQTKEEEKTILLEKEISKEEITNPTVRKALIESKNLLNAIILKYGSPTEIHIEVTREMAKSEKQKARIRKSQQEIEILKNNLVEEIKSDRPDVSLSSTQILKLRLWKEQDGRCLYSNKKIDLEDVLFDENMCQIDHILPYSRSFDNSYNNKVLVLTKENQEKGNKTPFEAFDERKWYEFEVRIKCNHMIPYRKKLNLLNTDFRENEKGFLSRNLNNTSYITDYFSKYIRNNLKFKQSDRKKKVICVNGAITGQIRYLFGLEKDRGIETHHAIDAAIVAITGDYFIQQISNYYKYRERNEYKLKKEKLRAPRPWDNFEYELKAKEKEIFVSRSEKIKFSGSAHDDTIYSYKGTNEKGYHIIGKKVEINQLVIDKDNNLSYGRSWRADQLHPLYNIIYDAIKNSEDLDKLKTPSKKGTPNSIKKIMVYREVGSGNINILHDKKSAKIGGDIIRTDVFKKDNKFYFVPIYVADLVKKDLPTKAIKKKTPKSKWIDIDDTYEFMFSMYKNTVLKVNRTFKGKNEEFIGYLSVNPDVSEARFEMIYHDGEDIGRITFGNLIYIEKYKVDILGNLEKVEGEVRQK